MPSEARTLPADVAPAAQTWPSPAAAWGAVAVLVAAGFLCTMDRFVLNLLVDEIRKDLRISDTQFSLLQGASFTIVNALAVFPLGLLADRWSRRWVLALGLAAWSVATVASGLAHSFGALFAARLFVGLGEAALWPVAVSMIADLLPASRRGRAIGLVMLGQILGGSVSSIMTGLVMRHPALYAHAFGPLLQGLAPWREVLVLWGLTGAPVLILLLVMPEPARIPHPSDPAPSMASFLRFLKQRIGVFGPLLVASACISTGSYGLAAWGAAFYLRRFSMTPAELGPVVGLIGLVGGVTGTLLAGALADGQERIGRRDRKLLILAIAAFCCLQTCALWAAPAPAVGYVIQTIAMVFFPITGAMSIMVAQDFAPGPMRGKVMALMTLAASLVGATLGPTLIAMINQAVFHDPAKIGVSMPLVLGPAMLLAGASFLAARAYVRRTGAAAI